MEKNKIFTISISKDLWVFLKTYSAQNDQPMGKTISQCVEAYRKKYDKKYNNVDTNKC